MVNKALSIAITIVLVLVFLAIALWLLEVISGMVGSLIIAVLVVIGILYVVRAITTRA